MKIRNLIFGAALILALSSCNFDVGIDKSKLAIAVPDSLKKAASPAAPTSQSGGPLSIDPLNCPSGDFVKDLNVPINSVFANAAGTIYLSTSKGVVISTDCGKSYVIRSLSSQSAGARSTVEVNGVVWSLGSSYFLVYSQDGGKTFLSGAWVILPLNTSNTQNPDSRIVYYNGKAYLVSRAQGSGTMYVNGYITDDGKPVFTFPSMPNAPSYFTDLKWVDGSYQGPVYSCKKVSISADRYQIQVSGDSFVTSASVIERSGDIFNGCFIRNGMVYSVGSVLSIAKIPTNLKVVAPTITSSVPTPSPTVTASPVSVPPVVNNPLYKSNPSSPSNPGYNGM